MLRSILHGKIYRATVTETALDYEGSIALDPALIESADFLPGEKVLVVNVNNGARFETYVMVGKPGQVSLNGAAARLGMVGDKVIIMSFCLLDEEEARRYKPRIVHVDEQNDIVEMRE